jgi:hypothetical protein
VDYTGEAWRRLEPSSARPRRDQRGEAAGPGKLVRGVEHLRCAGCVGSRFAGEWCRIPTDSIQVTTRFS